MPNPGSDPGLTPGVAILVWRAAPELEVLLLHRSRFAPDFEGDWAWMTPGGRLEAREDAEAAARRELVEETGLVLACTRVASRVADERRGVDMTAFVAEAPSSADVRLSAEHDRFEWVRPDELERCRPPWLADVYRELLTYRGQTRV